MKRVDDMKTKAFILRIKDPRSEEYAKHCAKSCDDVGLDWEYFQGFQNMKGAYAWSRTGIRVTRSEGKPRNFPKPTDPIPKVDKLTVGEIAECCTAGHAAIWKKIADSDLDVGIVLEHDALMLHNIDTLTIPDGYIVVLGYKTSNPERYNHIKAGPPQNLIAINGHEGAHAYAMTKKTAQLMINEIETVGRLGCVDNAYFILNQRKTQLPLAIANPTPAIGWLRESTIWGKSAERNYTFIPSFQENYK